MCFEKGCNGKPAETNSAKDAVESLRKNDHSQRRLQLQRTNEALKYLFGA
jgi:hypothetical protein